MTTTTQTPAPDAGGLSVAGPTEPNPSVAKAAPENPLTDTSLELETNFSLKPPSLEEARAFWALARS